MRQTAYPQDPAAGLAEEFLQHRGRFRWLPTSPPSSPPREGGQPRRLFSSSSRARESAIHADYSGGIDFRPWFCVHRLTSCAYVVVGPDADRCAHHGVTRRNTAPERRAALFIATSGFQPSDSPRTLRHPIRSRTIIPERESSRISTASHSLGTLSERLSSCGRLEAINPHEGGKVNERPVIMFDLTR